MSSIQQVAPSLMEAHLEARAALDKTRENHCPFGCEVVDEYGYCHHLVGFTNDRNFLEPVQHLYRNGPDGVPYDTGFYIVSGSEPCKPGDVFVNPERWQVDKGVSHKAKRWVSDRVYRRDAERREVIAKGNPVPENVLLRRRLAELETRAADRKMRERIAELEAELEADDKPKSRRKQPDVS